MVARLAEVLDVPLRERNRLLLAAGYAPIYPENDLGTNALAQARQAVEFLLKQLEPFPAVVVDRHWNLLQANGGATRFMGWLIGGPPPDTNLLRLVCRDSGLRHLILNWEEIAGHMLHRLQLESAGEPEDSVSRRLLAEVRGYPGIPDHWFSREPAAVPPAPLLTMIFRKDNRELRFFSTITTFGTPRDITLQELRIESWYPADTATQEHCRALHH
jgi:hypothetical protein